LYHDARDQHVYAVFVKLSVSFGIGFEAHKFIYQLTFRGNPSFCMRIQIKYKNKNKILPKETSPL